MTTPLPDIAPTTFKVQVRSDFPWIPYESIQHHCRWLDDVLEYLAHSRSIPLERVMRVEFQQVHNGTWTQIEYADLQEAIQRISAQVASTLTGGSNAH